MTPKDQQIAIALACGYRWYWTTDGLTEDGSTFKWKANLCFPPEEGIGKAWIGCAGESREMTPEEITEATRTGAFYTYAPRYLESLDAMHQAVKQQDEPTRVAFCSELARMMTRLGYDDTGLFHYHYVNATAAQRAEAFLRVKGLWVEDNV